MGVRVSVVSGISGAVAATAARGKDGRERGREGWGRTHVADVGQVFVPRHAERSQESVRQKRGRPAEHRSYGFCGGTAGVSVSKRAEKRRDESVTVVGANEYVRTRRRTYH